MKISRSRSTTANDALASQTPPILVRLTTCCGSCGAWAMPLACCAGWAVPLACCAGWAVPPACCAGWAVSPTCCPPSCVIWPETLGCSDMGIPSLAQPWPGRLRARHAAHDGPFHARSTRACGPGLGSPGPGSTCRRPVDAFPEVPGCPGVVLTGPRQPVFRSRPPVVPEAPAAQALGDGGGQPDDRVRALLGGAQDRPRCPAEPRQRGGDAGGVRPARRP